MPLSFPLPIMIKPLTYLPTLLSLAGLAPLAVANRITHIPAAVDFSATMQEWDGFGFNYVEATRTRDYTQRQEDLGGFSFLSESDKEEIVKLVFGREGLGIEILKMFLDPFHQADPEGPFDHTTTTSQMLYFAEKGHALARSEGGRLEVITTLYGPPAWASLQKVLSGRDLDPARRDDLAEYMIDWVRFLRARGLAVRYLSPHNEGEDFYRWDFDEGTQRMLEFDYNMYWPPELVNEFIVLLSTKLRAAGMAEVGVTNGEPSNWTRFYHWGYAHALARDPLALQDLSLLTTHGFVNGDLAKLSYSTINGATMQLLQARQPQLKAWVTSFSWGTMNTHFVRTMHEHIYHAGVSALIPWAGLQSPPTWEGKEPNPGTAIKVDPAGSYSLTPGYHLYRQLTQAGRRGMKVATTMVANPKSALFAWAGAHSGHPDAFVLVSDINLWKLPIRIEVTGSRYSRFRAFRSNSDGSEASVPLGEFTLESGSITCDPPPGTVTTFIGLE